MKHQLLLYPQTADMEVHTYSACGWKPGIDESDVDDFVKSPKSQPSVLLHYMSTLTTAKGTFIL